MSDCKHEVSSTWVSYCSGFTNEKVEVTEIKKCDECGWTWIETHTGKYVRETEPKIYI